MDATRLYLADCVGVIVLPISRIIISSAYKELRTSNVCQPRTCESQDIHVRGTGDVSIKLQLSLCVIIWRHRGKLLHV